jgi:peptidoglycan/LPS O-acetylase OafA/YrhL
VLLLPRSYLAVDLFFTLSGFVIAYSYQHRLEAGLPRRRYFLARLVRLYPLYIAATLLAAAWSATGHLRDGDFAAFGPLGSTLAMSALFLPTPNAWSSWPGSFFPLVYPAWSLFFELVVNALYGLVALRLSNRLLAVLVAFGAAGLVLAVWQAGTVDVGSEWKTAQWAFGRAVFSFFAGVAVYRWRDRLPIPALPAWLLGLVLIAAFLPPEGDGAWIYDLACITVLFPLLVRAGAGAASGPRVRAFSREVGALSYPVYVLQQPLIAILMVLYAKSFGTELAETLPAGLVLQFAVVVAIAWLALRLYDEPVRGWLKRRLLLPRAAAQTAP